jgi:hypothetical protein
VEARPRGGANRSRRSRLSSWTHGRRLEPVGGGNSLSVCGNQQLQHASNPVDRGCDKRLLAVSSVAGSVQDSESPTALEARILVVVVMFFARRGHWGTHYDRPSGPFKLDFWPEFLWFGLFEELIYWVSFIVAIGSLAGSAAAAAAKWRLRESQPTM